MDTKMGIDGKVTKMEVVGKIMNVEENHQTVKLTSTSCNKAKCHTANNLSRPTHCNLGNLI